MKKFKNPVFRVEKPRIKWWGDGDVYASCFSVYRKCYPNAIATFRSEPIPFFNPKRKIVKIHLERDGYEYERNRPIFDTDKVMKAVDRIASTETYKSIIRDEKG